MKYIKLGKRHLLSSAMNCSSKSMKVFVTVGFEETSRGSLTESLWGWWSRLVSRVAMY